MSRRERPRGWLFTDLKGQERIGQFVDTRLLRFKVVLWHRPIRRLLRWLWVR